MGKSPGSGHVAVYGPVTSRSRAGFSVGLGSVGFLSKPLPLESKPPRVSLNGRGRDSGSARAVRVRKRVCMCAWACVPVPSQLPSPGGRGKGRCTLEIGSQRSQQPPPAQRPEGPGGQRRLQQGCRRLEVGSWRQRGTVPPVQPEPGHACRGGGHGRCARGGSQGVCRSRQVHPLTPLALGSLTPRNPDKQALRARGARVKRGRCGLCPRCVRCHWGGRLLPPPLTVLCEPGLPRAGASVRALWQALRHLEGREGKHGEGSDPGRGQGCP